MKNESSAPYFLVTDENLPSFGPQYGNRIIHSKLTHIEKKRVQADLSLKLVLKGTETYRLDGHTYEVNAGQFLLVNKDQEVDCFFKSTQVTEGMCVYLDPEFVSQAFHTRTQGDKAMLDDPALDSLPRNIQFLDARYHTHQNQAGHALQQLSQHLPTNPEQWQGGDPQLFVWLADQLVASQEHFLAQANKLKAEKASTRKELYRRLLIAKEMIDARFREDIDLEAVSRASALSMYHMLRNFREAFGVTPHQYLMQRRLEYARYLLQHGGLRITDVAQQSGFGDLHNFSKAFRKRFGISPRSFTRDQQVA